MTLDWVISPQRPRDEPEPAAQLPVRAPAASDGARPPVSGRPAARAMKGAGAPGLLPTKPEDLWVPLGPAVVVAGQAELKPRISGRARALKVSSDGRRAYVGTAQGGTWITTDGGASWTALDFYATTRDLTGKLDESNSLAVGALAVRFGADPAGADDEVYVGTGERRHVDLTPLPMSTQGVGIRVAKGPGPLVRANGPTADPWTLEATDLAGATVLRIVIDETGNVWALTSKGLYRRPPGGGSAWTLVDTGIPDAFVTDIAVTRGGAGEAQRIYVASLILTMAWSVTGDAGTWKTFDLAPFPGITQPSVDVMLARGNTPGKPVVFAIGDRRRMWRIEGEQGQRVLGLPGKFVEKQADYDLAVVAHPSTAEADRDRVAIGGAAVVRDGDTDWNAELYVGKVTKSGGATWLYSPQYVGSGVHPDVHELAWVPGPGGSAPELWVACDGGVFRSTADAARHTFRPRNTGLASLETQYLAQHPATDGLVFAGTQDNGTIRQVSAETWTVASEGDGGWTQVDPLDPRRVMTQYVRAAYYGSANGGATFDEVKLVRDPPSSAGASLRAKYVKARKAEDEASSFYSGSAVIAAGSTTRLAVGTDRVWLTTDWGKSWVTLPTAKDPYAPGTPGAPNRTQDQLPADGRVFALRWGRPDLLYALSGDGVFRLAESAGAWTRTQLYDRPKVLADAAAAGGATPAGQIPAELPITDLAPHDPARGSLYAVTSGVGGQHVWWFDGAGSWIATGLLVDTPAHAVALDPAHPEVLYVGTDVGVWKGEGTFPAPGGGDPTWTWDPYSNGLPEAACIDLAVHAPTRLLRAALRGRGVWEVALDGVAQGPEVYLRAHAYDTRRRPVAPGGDPDPLGAPTAPGTLRLDASPDLRVYRAPGTDPPPAPITLPLNAKSNPFDLWALQAARRTAGKRTPVDGSWGDATLAAMRPIPATPEQWSAALGGPKANTPPFDHDPPDAADIAVNLRDEPDRKAGATASCVTGDGLVRVYVTVHSRDWRPVPGDHVAVCVLKTPGTLTRDLSGVPALPNGWAASLVADITAPAAARGAWLTGSPWAYLEPGNPFRTLPRALDPAAPQAVMFEVRLDSPAWPPGGWLLLAVHHAPEDKLTTTETSVQTLVRTKRHLAARSVRRFA